jgi:hypothetical protein
MMRDTLWLALSLIWLMTLIVAFTIALGFVA